MTKQQFIPDISFHLIFCFLTLKELTFIAQCSRHFKRLVTNPSFLNMVSFENMIDIKNKHTLVQMIESPFQHTVKNIKHSIELLSGMLVMITQFTRLKKLTLRYKPNEKLNSPATLKSLEELDILFIISHDTNLLLFSFSSFPNLIKLNLCYENRFLFPFQFDSDKLAQLQNLETLNITDYHGYLTNSNIIETIRSLPVLKVLGLHGFSFTDNRMGNLQRLCAQPGAPRLLKIIDSESFSFSLTHSELLLPAYEIAHLLEQLPALNQIRVTIFNNIQFPIELARWTKSLSIFHSNFNIDDITALSHFNNLESFCLHGCNTNGLAFEKNISRQLKSLTIKDQHSKIISFERISQFTELTHLCLEECWGLLASDFHFLFHCRKLETIQIQSCWGLKLSHLSDQCRAALKLPSYVFPSLKDIIIR
jgi:hypothetical protein